MIDRVCTMVNTAGYWPTIRFGIWLGVAGLFAYHGLCGPDIHLAPSPGEGQWT